MIEIKNPHLKKNLEDLAILSRYDGNFVLDCLIALDQSGNCELTLKQMIEIIGEMREV